MLHNEIYYKGYSDSQDQLDKLLYISADVLCMSLNEQLAIVHKHMLNCIQMWILQNLDIPFILCVCDRRAYSKELNPIP